MPRLNQWNRLFELAATNGAALRILDDAVVAADRIMLMDPSCYRRPAEFNDIPINAVDAIALSAGPNRDARALSMSDCTQSNFLRSHGVTLALAVRKSGRADHTARMNDILRSVLDWTPFQRPGWSLGTPSMTLATGGDGVNMATSWGIVGLVDILEILDDRIPSDLRASLEDALRRELGSVVDSWVGSRSWYVQSDAVVSNQWIDPNAAVVHACLYLRDDRLRPVYDFAVGNLLRSLNTLQPDGAFLEGMTYAQMSLPTLFRAVNAMASAGDTRLQSVPFVRNSWRWMLCAQMPGGNLVSGGDSQMAALPNWAMVAPLDCFALAALSSDEPEAVASMRALFPGCGSWSSAAAYAAALVEVPPAASPTISPWGYFPSQQLVTWREEWSAPTASSSEMGIWIKGGSLLERSHGQRDQGQVSIYSGATPILMECGTPSYGDPQYLSEFASARGHGVMQVEPVLPSNRAVSAPAEVERLDGNGGKVRLNLVGVYQTTTQCERLVEWSRLGITLISDSVEFSEMQPAGTEVYRFHLGARVSPSVERSGDVWTVSWDSASVQVSSSSPIALEVIQVRDVVRGSAVHYALAVKLTSAVQTVAVATEVTVRR